MRDTSNDVNMSREELKDWMRRHDFTIEELANFLGMTNNGIMYWVTGHRKIPEPMGRLLKFFDLRDELIREF